MNPPLEARSADPPDPGLPTLSPNSVHDLRGRAIEELRYSPAAALIVAGVPGAGKSTALHRLFAAAPDAEGPNRGPQGALVLDSQQARNHWRHRLRRLPYPLWRPVVHIAHFRAIRTALREEQGPIVIHDCATFRWTRVLIGRWVMRFDRDAHLIMLDVPAAVARDGQRARGRRINPATFRWHVRRWRQLMRLVTTERRAPIAGTRSVVVVDRAALDQVRRVSFAP